MIPDGWRKAGIVGGVQGVAAHAWDGDHVLIGLEPGAHGPEYILHIKTVHILVHQKHVF